MNGRMMNDKTNEQMGREHWWSDTDRLKLHWWSDTDRLKLH
jgi:hypothetical protein